MEKSPAVQGQNATWKGCCFTLLSASCHRAEKWFSTCQKKSAEESNWGELGDCIWERFFFSERHQGQFVLIHRNIKGKDHELRKLYWGYIIRLLLLSSSVLPTRLTLVWWPSGCAGLQHDSSPISMVEFSAGKGMMRVVDFLIKAQQGKISAQCWSLNLKPFAWEAHVLSLNHEQASLWYLGSIPFWWLPLGSETISLTCCCC